MLKQCLAPLALLALVIPAAPAAAQSFDCKKASTATEKAICDSPFLGAYDLDMAFAYKDARGTLSGDERTKLLDAQRAWLKERDRCGGDSACLEKAYFQRLSQLTKDYDIFRGWEGKYEGPFGDVGFAIESEGSNRFKVTFQGAGQNYTCGPLTGIGTPRGKDILDVTSQGTAIMSLEALGTGVYLPDNAVNETIASQNCGAQAPQVTETLYRRK